MGRRSSAGKILGFDAKRELRVQLQRLLADLIDALTYNQLVEKICNDQDPNIALYKEFFDCEFGFDPKARLL